MRMHLNIKSLISMMFAMVFSFVALFSFPVQADTISYSSITDSFNVVDNGYGYIYHNNQFSWVTLNDDLNNYIDSVYTDDFDDDLSYYRVFYTLNLDLTMSRSVYLNTFDLTLEVDDVDGRTISYVLLHNENKEFINLNNNYLTSGSFIVQAPYFSADNYRSSLSFTLYPGNYYGPIDYSLDASITIESVERLSPSEFDIFNDGYNTGFSDGSNYGYSNGYQSGYDVGFENGEDSGYGVGFDTGYSSGSSDGYSNGQSDGYSSGYLDGVGSVDTDSFYESGFLDGVGSVDTDSFYQSGYQAGLDAGYQDSYNEGYNAGVSFGYSEGFSEGQKIAQDKNIENLTNSGTSAAEKFEITEKVDFSRSTLKLSDGNTTLTPVYEFQYGEDWEYIRDYEYYSYLVDSYGDDYDGDGVYDYWDHDSQYFLEIFKDDTHDSYAAYRGWNYFYTGAKKLFTADSKYYAYKIKVVPYDINANYTNVNWARNTVGTWSDIMSGDSEIGIGYISGYSDQFTYFITTDNLPVDIYSAVLMYYYNEGINNTNKYASFDIDGNVYYEITPYSRNEYAAIMSGIDDLQGDINDRFGELEENLNQNFDDLMHSYDTSKGDLVNDNFQASLNEYETAENSLFNTATESLGAYEFFDFNSVPAMITGISFVTSLMTSIYTALGGVSGASGIILSILFSVMLVSMVLGLSRLYQSASRRSAYKNSSKPTRTKNDHIKK